MVTLSLTLCLYIYTVAYHSGISHVKVMKTVSMSVKAIPVPSLH